MDALVSADIFPAARRYAYLNAASVALMPKMAGDAIIEWQRDLATEGTVHFDEEAEANVFDTLRRAAARLLGAKPDEIACISSVSEALSSLAWALSPGPDSNVVSARVEFPSVVYPWLRVSRLTGCEVRLASNQSGLIDQSELMGLIDDQTSAVAVSQVQYSTGQRLDLAALARMAHSHGAMLVVDASQSAGAVPIDVVAEDVDVLAVTGYKWLCGPFGAAIMFVRGDMYDGLEPGLVGWRSTEQVWDFQADRLEWASGARRFEFSTMAYGCAIGLAEAVRYLLNMGIEKIQSYDLALASDLADGLAELGAEFVTPSVDDLGSSIVTVRLPGYDQGHIARRLNEEGVVASPRIGAVRFSPHLYNTADDIARALRALERILEGENR
jgi:cysteine desulfurase/selenocysteine lyase